MDFDLAFGLSSRAHGVYRYLGRTSTYNSTMVYPPPPPPPPPAPERKIGLLLNIIISFIFGLKSGPQGVQIFAFPRLNIATKEASLKKVKVRV